MEDASMRLLLNLPQVETDVDEIKEGEAAGDPVEMGTAAGDLFRIVFGVKTAVEEGLGSMADCKTALKTVESGVNDLYKTAKKEPWRIDKIFKKLKNLTNGLKGVTSKCVNIKIDS